VTGCHAESIAELIVLGRDREAVAMATQTSNLRTSSKNEGATMDGVQQLDEIIP
jgi:hypothetical protein